MPPSETIAAPVQDSLFSGRVSMSLIGIMHTDKTQICILLLKYQTVVDRIPA